MSDGAILDRKIGFPFALFMTTWQQIGLSFDDLSGIKMHVPNENYWQGDCRQLLPMRLTRIISLMMATILIAMLVCPAIAAAAEANNAKKMDHCSSEKPVPQEKQTMLCCCDQNAISVLPVHAPYQVPVSQILTAEPTIALDFVFAFDRLYLPYEKTGDHLSRLCVLRF